jgi:hypothetical protein
MAVQPNVLAMALNGYEQGRQLRREEKSRNALAGLLGGMRAPNGTPGIGDGIPGNRPMGGGMPTLDPVLSPGGGIGGGLGQGGDMVPMGGASPGGIDYSAFTPEDLRTAITIQGQQREQQQAQTKQRGEQMQQLGRLLNHATDETTYQQSLAAAKQIGLDVSSAPPSFDPNWVGQQKLVLQAYEKDGGQALSNYGKIAVDEGFRPGTPQYTARVTQLYTADQVKTIPTQPGGGVAQYNPATGRTEMVIVPNQGGYAVGAPVQPGTTQQPTQQRKPITVQAAMKAVQDVGAGAAQFIRNNGFAVQVTSPQEARQLPSGTPILLPDGSEGVVP